MHKGTSKYEAELCDGLGHCVLIKITKFSSKVNSVDSNIFI